MRSYLRDSTPGRSAPIRNSREEPRHNAQMKFSELPVGARFRFFARGLSHVKVSSSSYELVTGGTPNASSPDADVLLQDLALDTAEAPAKPKKKPAEQQAREMLERIGVPNVKKFSSAALAELTALIEKKSK
jgi:hypothetical protein